MLTDFENIFTDRLSSKFMGKRWSNIPPHLKCVATLPCEMFVLKIRNDPKLSEATFRARVDAQKYPPNDVSIIFVHWQKDVCSGHAENPTEWPVVCTSINQEERRCDETPMHTCTQLTFSHWPHQSASNKWLTVVEYRPWSQGYWEVLIMKWCCHNSSCSVLVAIHQISREFIFQQDRALQTINCFTTTLPNVGQFENCFKTDSAVNL